MRLIDYFLICLLSINLFGFFLSAWDKRAAIKNRRRVPEKALFVTAILGGSVGLYISMLLFRHKTRHLSFMIGVPLIFIAQLLLAWFVWRNLT